MVGEGRGFCHMALSEGRSQFCEFHYSRNLKKVWNNENMLTHKLPWWFTTNNQIPLGFVASGRQWLGVQKLLENERLLGGLNIIISIVILIVIIAIIIKTPVVKASERHICLHAVIILPPDSFLHDLLEWKVFKFRHSSGSRQSWWQLPGAFLPRPLGPGVSWSWSSNNRSWWSYYSWWLFECGFLLRYRIRRIIVETTLALTRWRGGTRVSPILITSDIIPAAAIISITLTGHGGFQCFVTLIKKMDLAAKQLLGETLKWSNDVIIDNDIAQLMDYKAVSFWF